MYSINNYNGLNFETFVENFNYDKVEIEVLQDIANYLKITIGCSDKYTIFQQINKHLISNGFEKPQLQHPLPTTNIESSELSFFKVFRNKVLFKEIFSYFNTIHDYDNIIGVEDTLNKFSNGEAIIKDKIKGGHSIFKNKANEFEILLKTIYSQTTENQLFYNQVFKNFKNKDINITNLLQIIIEQLNITALKEFLNIFYFQQPQLQNSPQTTQQQIKSFIELCYNDHPQHFYQSYRSIKFLNFLFLNQFLSLNKISINYFNESITLKKLIKYYNILKTLIIKIYVQNQNNKINNLMDELNQVQINSFKNEILNLNIRDLINNDNYGVKTLIQKYYKLFYINQIKPIQYYLYFKNQNKINMVIQERNLNQYEYYQDYLEIILSNNDEIHNYIYSCIIELKDTELFNFFNYITNQNNKNHKIFNLFFNEVFSIGNDKLDNYIKTTPKIEIFKSIKTTLLYDYLFKFHQQEFFDDLNKNWKLIHDIKLLEYYESLLVSLNRKMLIQFTNSQTLSPLSNIKTNDEMESVFWNINCNRFNVFDQYFRSKNNKAYIKKVFSQFRDELNMVFDIRACINNNQQESLIQLLSSGEFQTFRFGSFFFDYHLNKPYDYTYHYYYEKNMDKVLKWVFKDISEKYLLEEYNKVDGSYKEDVIIQLSHSNLKVIIRKQYFAYYLSKAGLYSCVIEIMKSVYKKIYNSDNKLILENFTIDALQQYINSLEDNQGLDLALVVAAKKNYLSIFKSLNYSSSGLNLKSIHNIINESIKNNNIILANYLVSYFNFTEQDYKTFLKEL